MSFTDLVGYVATILSTIAFVPQVWQVIQTKQTRDISLRMYALFTSGVALWLIYGISREAWPLVIDEAVTLVLASIVLVMKLRYKD